ncbi:MAG: lytic transglycosylase domain-containing protein [Acidobacteriota bacterium]
MSKTALVMAATVALSGLARGAGAQYLVVTVDGRLMPVAGAKLLDERRIRLELKEGASIEMPLERVERVIEDLVEEQPRAIPIPSCQAGFADEPLPAGTPFAAEIAAASRAANLHPWLVAAVVQAESGFNPHAVSRVGARGLMQLMPAVWIERRIANPHAPSANLRAGSQHLRALLDRFGSVELALAAYNAGAAVVERANGVPAYHETRDYLRRVLAVFCPPA